MLSKILSFIEGYMSGNAWEELCVQCYRIRYQEDNYTVVLDDEIIDEVFAEYNRLLAEALAEGEVE